MDVPYSAYPPCPFRVDSIGLTLVDESSGLLVFKDSVKVGTWRPLSSSAIEISLDGLISSEYKDEPKLSNPVESGGYATPRKTPLDLESGQGRISIKLFLSHDSGDRWIDQTTRRYVTFKSSKRKRALSPPSRSTPGTPSSRFRTSSLPLSPLDAEHRALLGAIGLRICMHADVGRVLVTSRNFSTGSAVIVCKVDSFDNLSEDDLTELIEPTHPSGAFIHVPRLERVFYNKKFSESDPVASGDIWYLVNHSDNPNCELKAVSWGIIVRAKKNIRKDEPLTWAYNSGFFDKSDKKIDLPSTILPDETIVWGG